MEAGDPDTIRSRLSEARNQSGLTRKEAAERIGTAASTIENWEYGNSVPKASDLARACSVYNVSPEWILGFIDRPRILAPGWYLVDREFIDELLATTDPKVIARLCDDHQGPIVEFGSIVREGAQLLPPEEGAQLERRVVNHVAEHGRGSLRRAFKQHLDTAPGE